MKKAFYYLSCHSLVLPSGKVFFPGIFPQLKKTKPREPDRLMPTCLKLGTKNSFSRGHVLLYSKRRNIFSYFLYKSDSKRMQNVAAEQLKSHFSCEFTHISGCQFQTDFSSILCLNATCKMH